MRASIKKGSERHSVSDFTVERRRAVRERADVLVEERLVGADDFGSAKGSERRESAIHLKKEREIGRAHV